MRKIISAVVPFCLNSSLILRMPDKDYCDAQMDETRTFSQMLRLCGSGTADLGMNWLEGGLVG